MVVEVPQSHKVAEKNEEVDVPAQIVVHVDSPSNEKKHKKKAYCRILLFLLVVSLVAAGAYLGWRSFCFQRRLEEVMKNPNRHLDGADKYGSLRHLRLDLVTDAQWEFIADTITRECLLEFEDVELEEEADGSEEISDENIFQLNPQCLQEKMKLLKSMV